jgi:hypothetical protein
MSATAAVDCPAGNSRTLPGEVSAHMLRCPRASAASIRVLISRLRPVLSCAAVTASAPLGKRRGLLEVAVLMLLMRSNMVAKFCKGQGQQEGPAQSIDSSRRVRRIAQRKGV